MGLSGLRNLDHVGLPKRQVARPSTLGPRGKLQNNK